jgi:transposase
VILWSVMNADDSLPDDVTTLQAMLCAERAARLAAEAEALARTPLIEKLKLTIKKLQHEQFGQSSERGALLDQLELQLTDLEENAAQAETAAQVAAEKIAVPSFERASQPAGRCRSICRGSASSIRHRRSAHAVATADCARSAKT